MLSQDFIQQFGQFVTQHLMAFLALLCVLILIIVNETLSKKQQAKEISPQTVVDLINQDKAHIFDLRETAVFRAGHIIHAIQAASEDFFTPAKIEQYQTKSLILVCANGQKSHTIAKKLRQKNVSDILVLSGGMSAWESSNLPVVKGK